MEGTVFNIQRFSIHDGPGIRTTVFMKGCNLRCFWCHNPESWQTAPQVQTYFNKCIGCGACFERCPRHCHELADGERVFRREDCIACGACTETCYAEALVMTGYRITVEDLLTEVKKDEVFYKNSNGGVTFSGGECMVQIDFLAAALAACRGAGLHTVVDTAGHVPYDSFQRILKDTDLFLYDFKCFTPETHRKGTGADNNRIMANLRQLLQDGARVWVRIPVVPGFNTAQEEMEAMAAFLAGLPPLEKVELLPFHRLGEGKLSSLGQGTDKPPLTPPTAQEMDAFVDVFRRAGLPAEHA